MAQTLEDYINENSSLQADPVRPASLTPGADLSIKAFKVANVNNPRTALAEIGSLSKRFYERREYEIRKEYNLSVDNDGLSKMLVFQKLDNVVAFYAVYFRSVECIVVVSENLYLP